MRHWLSCQKHVKYTSRGFQAFSVCRQYLHWHGLPHRCNSVSAPPSKNSRLPTKVQLTGFGADARMYSTCLCTSVYPTQPRPDAAFLAGSRSDKQASIVMLVSTHVATQYDIHVLDSKSQFVAYPVVSYHGRDCTVTMETRPGGEFGPIDRSPSWLGWTPNHGRFLQEEYK